MSTLKQILKSPERGGLVANNLVFRYDTVLSDDGVGGEEGGTYTLLLEQVSEDLTCLICSILTVHPLGSRGSHAMRGVRQEAPATRCVNV